MATTVLNVVSTPFPAISNRIRAAIYRSSDPMAIVAFLIDSTPGHPQRNWHFPGLARDNYKFSLDEINISDVVVSNLAIFDVVPGVVSGLLSRKDEQIKAGATPGFNVGSSTFLFDGSFIVPGDSATKKPDYRGWDIVPSELNGRGILVEGIDYSWNETSGLFSLLNSGDTVSDGQWYNIHFEPSQQNIVDSVPTIFDFKLKFVSVTSSLLSSDFTKHVIVDPVDNYIELTLPDISTIPEGRIITIETVRKITPYCVKINSASTISFLRGSLYMCPGESVSIYKFIHPSTGVQYRVVNSSGSFRTCGQIVSDDIDSVAYFNKQLLDGSSLNRFQYARLYNEIVLNLPPSQLIDFDDWITDKTKYSRANSNNPLYPLQFRVPDRRNLFERSNSATGSAGNYMENEIQSHVHVFPGDDSLANWNHPPFWTPVKATPSVFSGDLVNTGGFGHCLFNTSPEGGSETRPECYLINKYVLL